MGSTNYLNARHGIEILHDSGTTQILAGEHAPNDIGVVANLGSIYMCSCTSGTIYKKTGANDIDWTPDWDFQLIKTYIGLLDTPTTYSGYEGMYPRVNNSGTGLDFNFIEFDLTSPETPLIPETAVSGTYLVNFEGGRLLIGAIGNKPDLVYNGPVSGLAFSDKFIESCYGSFKIPPAWNTDSDIKVKINFMNDDSQSGAKVCSWRMEYHSYAPGEQYSSKISTVVDIDYTFPADAPAGTFWTHELFMDSNDVNNDLERGDIVVFRFYRDGSDSLDTMTGDCVLITLMIELQTGQHIVGDS